MWNRPQLMQDVADLVFMAGTAALLVAGVVGAARLPLFPIREVVVTNELREVRRVEIERALAGNLRGNFFSVKLDALKQSLERLPWVRRAAVRRRWPSRLDVAIEEHVPMAFWGAGSGHLVNSHGEIFMAGATAPPPEALPVLAGPANFVHEMVDTYRLAVDLIRPIGRAIRVLNVSPRLALQLTLDDGTTVRLGREQTRASVRERLARFVEFYPSILTAAGGRPEIVDMRYPNGFALHLSAASEKRGRGKP
jgi:cell division protein FtsQ